MASYKIKITYTGPTVERLRVDNNMVLTWTTKPYPADADANRRKLVAIEYLCTYLKANGGVKLEIKEQP